MGLHLLLYKFMVNMECCPLAQIRTDVKFLLCLYAPTKKVKIGLIKIGCFEVRRLNVDHLTFGMLFTVSLY